MMDYTIFKEVVREKLAEYLPEKLQGAECMIRSVNKINTQHDEIIFPVEGELVTPAVELNDMYEEYVACEDLEKVLWGMKEKLETSMQAIPDIRHAMTPEYARRNIYFQLINTEQNKKLLQNIPNRPYQDLSVIYRLHIGEQGDKMASMIINNYVAETDFGLSEEQLFALAKENTKRMFPPEIKSLNELIKEMMLADGVPQEYVDMVVGNVEPEQDLWVLTNQSRKYGASFLLYEDQLQEIAQKLGTDLYILPSSIHETLAAPVSLGNPAELAEMVAEVNREKVALSERLSNQVYHYDRNKRELSLATDTPDKRLDQMENRHKETVPLKTYGR